MAETTPIYATFSGNCLHLDNGVEINGFPDGTRGKFRVKIVSVEQGMFEHIDEDLDGCTNHDYYPVKITTVGLSDGTTRTHLTNDETMFAPGNSGGLPIVEAALRPDGDISVVGEYYTQDNILRSLCHGIKDGNADDIARAARLMAKLVRPGDTLVPIPSRTGVATTAKLLAEAISKITGAPVADILKGASRKSMYEMKKGGTIPGEEFLGLRLEGEPPENTVFVDNVVATGTTARAALRLVPGSRLIALANASTHQPDWNIPVDFRGKSENPELNMTEAADGDGTDGVFERIAQKAAELEPFGIDLLQKNCVDSLWKVSEPTGGMMRKATRPIRFIHYTASPEALESILNAGIRQNICIETSRNDVWANILSKDLLDRNKLFVVFDIPEGTPFSLENNTQAVFFQTIPPEWFVSVNTDIGPRGNTRLLDYIGRHDERWPEQRVREFFDDPENADIWSYITRPTLDRLLKLYTGFDIRHDGTQELTEGISAVAVAFVESASDERIMRIASQLADKFLTPDTVKAISDKFDDMEYLSVFGTDDDFRITKEIKEPFHIVITAALESAVGGKDAGKRKAVTYYGNPPKITLFLSDSTGKPMSAYGVRRYTKMDRNFEDLRKRLISSWREVLIHELSHALDQLTRGSNRFNPHSRQSMLKSARNASDSYANNLLETNARIPQLGNMLCIRTLERPQAGAQAFPSFNDAVRLFDEIMPFSRMTDDTKRRTVKRMHDIWARLKGVWDRHHDEIKTVQDFQKFLAVGQDAHIGELLGDCAVLDTVSSGRMKVRRVGDDTYKVVEGDRPGDVGAVVKFSPEPTYNPANPQKIRIDTLTMPDGKKISGATLMVKSVKKEKKGMTEGISMVAAAFVESAGETVGSAFKLCPADLVAIVARRIGAAADYDGLNYTADPDGMDLYLSNGYMDARLAYDTYCKALRSPTGGAEYPLDETTDLDALVKAIMGDMAPERFEERIAGKYDLGRDLVSCVADDLRKRAERDGKKIRVRNEGRKLSVVNPGVDDNCNSAELEWDPERRKLRCPDSGNEYDLDENTNIRKLGHELYERVGSMDL